MIPAQRLGLLRACLRALNANDTFTIQAFDDKIEWFAQVAQEVIQENIDLADQWLDGIASRGLARYQGAPVRRRHPQIPGEPT